MKCGWKWQVILLGKNFKNQITICQSPGKFSSVMATNSIPDGGYSTSLVLKWGNVVQSPQQTCRVKTEFKSVNKTKICKQVALGKSRTVSRSIEVAHQQGERHWGDSVGTRVTKTHWAGAAQPETSLLSLEQVHWGWNPSNQWGGNNNKWWPGSAKDKEKALLVAFNFSMLLPLIGGREKFHVVVLDLGVGFPWVRILFSWWTWASFSTSWILSFLFCKMSIFIPPHRIKWDKMKSSCWPEKRLSTLDGSVCKRLASTFGWQRKEEERIIQCRESYWEKTRERMA